MDAESEDYDPEAAQAALDAVRSNRSGEAPQLQIMTLEDEETLATEDDTATGARLLQPMSQLLIRDGLEAPDPADYGVWIPGIPALLENATDAASAVQTGCHGLIMDGIVAGVGAVLGFVPQMLILFIFLAFLEGLRLHGAYCIHHGPYLPQVRSVR